MDMQIIGGSTLFMRRHPELTVWQSVDTSKARTVDKVYEDDVQRMGTCSLGWYQNWYD